MGRSVVLSNGKMLVGLDASATVHDFYYPYVGLENLTTSRFPNHKVGVWVNGEFSWLDGGDWQIDIDFEGEALISDITATNDKLKLTLHFVDFVDIHYSAFCRLITITNQADHDSEVRLFMHQAFAVSRSGRSDTALFVPKQNYILDYKGWSSLLIYCQNAQGKPFDQWAVGNHGIEGKEGTFRDAEDGELSNSLVEHGSVDSTMRLSYHLGSGDSAEAQYWAVAAESQFDAEAVHHVFINKGAKSRLEETRKAWHQWMEHSQEKLGKVDEKYRQLAKKSLLLIKAHTDRHGGTIASSDSSIYNYGRDYYCYIWPRDGAYITLPLIQLGYTEDAKKFFEFCADTIHPSGYMMHKYQPDRSVGSTWHPLLHRHHPELAIQEDETAVVILALGEYMKITKDTDFVRSLWANFIKPAADFMAGFMDEATNLPHASYDLWEEKFATHTYTVVATMAALKTAATIAEQFGQTENANSWRAASERISQSLKALFNSEKGYYRKSFYLLENGNLEFDDTLDVSSGYGVMSFDDSRLNSEALSKTMASIEQKLLNSSPSGGAPRYEHDNYFLTKQQYLGNPWLITTLWMAQYYLKRGQKDKAKKLIDWAASHTTPSGMLAEQVDPEDGRAVGVTPLVWSHATFLETVLMLSEAG